MTKPQKPSLNRLRLQLKGKEIELKELEMQIKLAEAQKDPPTPEEASKTSGITT